MNNPINHKVLELASNLDDAYYIRNVNEIKRLIKQGIDLETSIDSISKVRLLYSIGTAYGNLFNLQNNCQYNSDNEYIVKQIYYFRKAISISRKAVETAENKIYIYPALCSLYTNYGNILDACGRKQLAIEMYNQAIRINPSFTMASGNLAIALDHYRYYINEDGHFHFVKEIRRLLKYTLSTTDPNRVLFAEECFAKLYDKYLEYDIGNECTCGDLIYNPSSKEYYNWCWNNVLFLNPLNDLQVEKINRYDDNLQISKLSGGSNEHMQKIFSMFNQLKQEYTYARFLCYESLDISVVHWADENVNLVDCLDYTQYSVRIEGLKTAFKTLYSLLDKVAMLINEYYELGIAARNVNFHSIWKKNSKLLSYIDMNIGLLAIFWITKDFDKGDDSLTANPESKKLKNIRNYLEHRFTNVTLDFFEENNNNNGEQFYIAECELRAYTLELLHLVREVIFSLKNAIEISEYKKGEKSGNTQSIIPTVLKEVNTEDKL